MYGALSLLETDLSRAVRKLHLQKVEASIFSLRPLKDWTTFLSRLTYLTIDEAPIVSETELVILLKQCKSLIGLALINAREVLISGGLLNNDDDRKDIRESLCHVTTLDLSCNSPYLSDLLFNRIVDCTPNLKNLVLSNTNILSHSGVYKKYYPESVKHFNSPSVLTLRNVTRFINERKCHLKSLNFYNSNISSAGLLEIGQIDGLDLTTLNVGKFYSHGEKSRR